MRSRHAGSILDVLLVVLIALGALFVIAFLLSPNLSRAREPALRISCASNLSQIYNAMVLYTGADRASALPRTIAARINPADSAAGDAVLTWGTGAEASVITGIDPDPFSPAFAHDTIQPNSRDKLSANDVSAAFFWLLRSQDLSAAVFVCPSSNCQPDRFDNGRDGAKAANSLNFGRVGLSEPRSNTTDYLSYSLHNPYAPSTHWRLATFADKLPLAADIAPKMSAISVALWANSRSKHLAAGNSPNHDRVGQNIVHADGHVQWSTTPLAGPADDNIYTSARNNASTPLALMLPASPADATLAISHPFPNPAPPDDTGTWVGIVLLTLIAAGVVTVVLFLRKVLRDPPTPAS